MTGSTTARTVVFDELGGPDVLRVEERELATPGPGEVRVRVEAIGLNRAEALFRAGAFVQQPSLPGSRIGYEAAGVVEAVGAGVGGLAAGDAVMAGPGIEMSARGVHAERVLLPAESVVPRPGGLDAVTAAATWLTYSTAYGGLLETGGLRPADHVVITAASSGVGLAAIQTASRLGAVPVAVTRSAAKRRRLLEHGAAHVVVSAEEDVVVEVGRLTGGAGAALLFDAVGGSALAELARTVAPGGRAVVYGSLGAGPLLMPRNWPISVHGYHNNALAMTPGGRRRIDAFLSSGLRDGTLRPVVGKVLDGLDRIRDAHRLLEAGDLVGKIVVRVG